ncbi:MAG: FecR family protein [Alkalispirochaetaceae bacterium]
MVEANRSPRRLLRRLSRLILIGLPALLGLVLIGVALSLSGRSGSISLPQELQTLRGETATLLSTLDGANRLRVSEEELSRLGAAALRELAEDSGEAFSLLGFGATTETNRITTDLAFRLILPGAPPIIGRIETTASFGFDMESRNDTLLLTPTRLRLGRLPLPPAILAAAYRRAVPAGTLRQSPVQLSDGAFALSLDFLNAELPPEVRVIGVSAVPEGMELLLQVDADRVLTLLSDSAPLLGRILPELESVLSEEGVDTDLEQLIAQVTAPEGSAETPEPAAVVSYLENEVEVLFDQTLFVPEIGEDLYVRSSVRTGPGSATELLLRDRSVLRISEETQFELQGLPKGPNDGTQLRLVSGGLRAKVNKMIDGDARFALRAGSATLGVRGTDIFVQIEPEGDLRVSVLAGSVGVTPEGGEETVIEANQELSVPLGSLAEDPRRPLELSALKPKRRAEIEATVGIAASPDDQDRLREQYRLASVLAELRKLGATVMAMTPDEQQRLGANLQQRIDMEWAREEFARLMANPQFSELMNSFGIDELPLRE